MRVMRSKRKSPIAAKALAALFVLAGTSLAVAYIWQSTQESLVTGIGVSVSESREVEEKPVESTANLPGSSAVETPSSEPDISVYEEETPETVYSRELTPGAAAFSEPVDYSYFGDALFFGDSISTGIPLYMKTVVPNAAIIAMTGVNPDSVNTSECIEVDDERVTMLEAAKKTGDRKKIYIMLGANGLDLDIDASVSGYKTFVKSVREQFPGAVVYVQSILPVTREVNKIYDKPEINNTRITEYNEALLFMCKELKVNYVDVAQAMEDEEGYLPTEASPLDGMHLTPEYYIKWFDYLRCHTVKG